MQKESKQKLYIITVVLENGLTRDINVKASTRAIACRRALKRTPGAIKVARNT